MNTFDTINIRGVSEDIIHSIGTINSNFFVHDTTFCQNLHAVEDSFCIPVDGILGKDFLKQYNCLLDYRDMSLTLHIGKRKIILNILEGPESNDIIIPPRSESIYRIEISSNSKSDTFVLDSKIFYDGVFSARCIVNKSFPYVRILNTTSGYKNVSKIFQDPQPLSEFDVKNAEPISFDYFNNNRVEKLMSILKNKWPAHHDDVMHPLCVEFADVFAVDDDPATTNNFYSQSLTTGCPMHTKQLSMKKSKIY